MRNRKDMRPVLTTLPSCSRSVDGLACTEWLPAVPRAGVIIIHGADSVKESHHDYARACVGRNLAALCFDQRGHGSSPGPLDGRMIDDVARLADHLRDRLGDPAAPIALRGSSLGGYLAIAAAGPARAAAVVAICPASAAALRRGLWQRRFAFAADAPAVDALLGAHDLATIVPALTVPLLLLHAEGDERVPVAHSRELAELAGHPQSRLIAVPGGHHRSVQHDLELQAESLRFLVRVLAPS